MSNEEPFCSTCPLAPLLAPLAPAGISPPSTFLSCARKWSGLLPNKFNFYISFASIRAGVDGTLVSKRSTVRSKKSTVV
jgi:hypothetical protein